MGSGREAGSAEGALDEVSAIADGVADAQRDVARKARRAARQRRSGARWSEIVESGTVLSLLQTMGRSAAKITSSAGALRVAVARGLASEGYSTRQIGERFGISHQRVSSLMSRAKR